MLNILAILLVVAGVFGLPLYQQKVASPCAAFVSELIRGPSEMALPSPDAVNKGVSPIEESMAKQYPHIPTYLTCTALYWDIWANPGQAREYSPDLSPNP
jgi:hypothetical protein